MTFFGNLQRNIIRLSTTTYFYFYWFSVSFIVFLITAFPLVKTAFLKYKTYREMGIIKVQLVEKISQLKNASKELEEYSVYTNYLDAYVPDKLKVEDYLVDVYVASSRAGFVLKSFTPVWNSPEGSYFVVKLEGSGYVPDLVREVEVIKKITEVSNVSTTLNEGNQTVVLNVKPLSE